MQAVYFPAKNEVAVGTLPDPRAGAGEVLVRVRASGICGTDFGVMDGHYGNGDYPIVPGHEYAGEIVEVGANVQGFTVGDHVVVDPNIECGECPACKRGWAHLCERLGAYGVTVNGGFASLSAVRATHIHPLGDMSFTMAALAEPMGCVLNGLSPLKDRWIDRAMIFGAGPIGLLMGLALKARGVDEVSMVDPDDERLQMAESHGLKAINAASDALEDLQSSQDLVADATGVPAVAGKLLSYASNGGACLFFGVCPPEARIELSPFEIFRRQLSIFGTHSLNHNIPQAIKTLKAIGPAVESLVTHKVSPEEIASVFAGNKLKASMKIHMVM